MTESSRSPRAGSPFKGTDEAEPALDADAAADHAPPRQPTPRPPPEQGLVEELAEATAKINRMGDLLPAMPQPEAKEKPQILRDSSVPPPTCNQVH